MRFSRVLSLGTSPTDVTIHDDESRSISACARVLVGTIECTEIIRITNAQDIPSVADVSSRDIIRIRKRRVAFNRDVIEVVDPTHIRKTKMTSQARRFARDSFHHATVAADRPHAVIEDWISRSVVARAEHL